LVQRQKAPSSIVTIAIVGKYVALHDAYLSVVEALHHAASDCDSRVEILWVSAEHIERDGPDVLLERAQGIVVPGGFGPRGIEGKIAASEYARTRDVPFLGLCLGMQCATIGFARHVLGAQSGANSTEFDPLTAHPVIDFMPDQLDITDKGGTMRLGAYPCALLPGSRAAMAYGQERVKERHRHRFEFNNRYRDMLEAAGLVISGESPDRRLVEIIELREHPWFVGTQFHPEFLSRPDRPHPLFRAFVEAALHTVRSGGQRALPLADL
jgi:CTP synthase